jgi:hypothetical protein
MFVKRVFIISLLVNIFSVYHQPIYSQDMNLQNNTDVSMYLKADQKYISKIQSESGDLWDEIGHHGPAVENLWVGYRIYFDKKAAIDIYSKYQPRLELKHTKWYTPKEMQQEGFGIDHYFVGNTIGCGSIRLWESDSVKMLNPVTGRSAWVVKEGSISQINMLSEGIPYHGDQIDILVRLTVYSNCRYAKVETFILADKPVRLVTGLNFNKKLIITNEINHLITWGKHRSGVALENVDVGAGLIYNEKDFEKVIKDENEYRCISKPTKYLQTWITSANAKEKELNTMEKFREHVIKLTKELIHH